MPRTRKSAPELTADQRRRQIIDILSAHLARMPVAIAIPSESPPESEHDRAERKLCQNSQMGLELSANGWLSVSRG